MNINASNARSRRELPVTVRVTPYRHYRPCTRPRMIALLLKLGRFVRPKV